MNNEIKEILDELKEYIIEDGIEPICEILNIDKVNLLVDYITNLQEQNNDLRKIYKNTYNRLFENGNDELARYFQAQIDDCPTFYVEPIIDFAKEWRDYKSRIDRAIEYMDNSTEFDYVIIEKAINILKGE